jgi:hypothetical protein
VSEALGVVEGGVMCTAIEECSSEAFGRAAGEDTPVGDSEDPEGIKVLLEPLPWLCWKWLSKAAMYQSLMEVHQP